MGTVNEIVGHNNPDQEFSLMVAFVVLFHHGARTTPNLRFYPSGTKIPEKEGRLVLDCGGSKSKFDQHNQSDAADMASLDRLVQDGLDEGWMESSVFERLLPLITLVSRNDRKGVDTASAKKEVNLTTPHVFRHLRKLIQGFNLLYPGRPEKVVDLTVIAFEAVIGHLLEHSFEGADLSGLSLEERIEKRNAADEGRVRELFSYSNLLSVVRQYVPESAAYWETEAERAFVALEKDWMRAVSHVADRNRTQCVLVNVPKGKYGHRDTLVVYMVRSDTAQLGEVAREGNGGKSYKGNPRPKRYLDHPSRLKADVVVQIFEDSERGTRFLISTRDSRNEEIELVDVAAELRHASLNARGIAVPVPFRKLLREPGRQSIRLQVKGREVEVPVEYLAEFRKAVGNGFATNRHAPLSPLEPEEILAIVRDVLRA